MKSMLPLAALLALAACAATETEQASAPGPKAAGAGAVIWSKPGGSPTTRPNRDTLRGADGEVYAFAPASNRDPQDLVAGCPHMNPQQRPRGSNCHGIFPEQCGADRVQPLIGQVATPALRERIASFAPDGDVRIYHAGDALIEDLRPGRLNVRLDSQDRIAATDCF